MSFLTQVDLDENVFPPFVALRKTYGYVPNLLLAQTLRPDVVQAETNLIGAILSKEGALTRRQKEYILLVSSAANLNTYCVTSHCELARALGFTDPDPDEIAADHRATEIPETDKALLDFAVKLTREPTQILPEDIEGLRRSGFDDPQILEAVQVTALSCFFNCLASGLGTIPDEGRPAALPRE